MKRLFLLFALVVAGTGLYAQKFNAADPACGRDRLVMSGRTTHQLFFFPQQVDQQMTAEIGKDVYILSTRTPFHVLEVPLRQSEMDEFLDVWQDYQRHALLQGGEKEFFVFFTDVTVTRTHNERTCPAKGSWYALLLKGIPVTRNKALLKALQTEDWQAEVAKIAQKSKKYTVLIEPLCADEYGGENCIFVM